MANEGQQLVAQLQIEIGGLEAQLVTCRATVADLQTQVDELTEYRELAQDLQTQVGSLTHQLLNCQGQKAALEDTVEEQRTDFEQLRDENQQLRNMLQNQRAAIWTPPRVQQQFKPTSSLHRAL